MSAISGLPPLFSFEVDVGTGFFIDAHGDIITNRHAVSACRKITFSGYRLNAQVAKIASYPRDPNLDLALLRTTAEPPAVLSIADGFWPMPDNGENVDVKKVSIALESLGPSESGTAHIIGYPGLDPRTTPRTDLVQLPLTATTTDGRHWFRIVRGFFKGGQSGSPVVYMSGTVAGVFFANQFDPKAKVSPDTEWGRRDGDGWASNNGVFIPGPVVSEFARQAGANLTNVVGPNPNEAVVHIFCFHTWPQNTKSSHQEPWYLTVTPVDAGRR